MSTITLLGGDCMITGNNSDNLTVACMALDIFSKSWCMNCKETNKRNNITFRCNECEFQKNNGHCLIKQFVMNHTGDLPKNFGSMGNIFGVIHNE